MPAAVLRATHQQAAARGNDVALTALAARYDTPSDVLVALRDAKVRTVTSALKARPVVPTGTKARPAGCQLTAAELARRFPDADVFDQAVATFAKSPPWGWA